MRRELLLSVDQKQKTETEICEAFGSGFSKVSDSLVPKEKEKVAIETEPTLKEMFEKVYVLLDCLTVSSEDFVAVDDDNVCTAPIEADKDILDFV
ncbi:SCAN domain-containing protein 3 [Trichonephila clavipes]|nr:SCAN domain-containing protein 3 [Trichonephila clavipes]